MGANNLVVLEIHGSDGWVPAAELRIIESPSKGAFAATTFEYLIDYATQQIPGLPCVSVRYPVDLERHSLNSWPAFVFDLIPSGAARRFWMRKLSLGEGPHSDWMLLRVGAFNPPGSVRVRRDSVHETTNSQPDGFSVSDVVNRTPEFLSYIEDFGGPIKGATGAGGDAPKYLLREDAQRRYHADLALADELTQTCWLVKYPRGNRSAADIEVLRGEELYSRLAKSLGLKTSKTPYRFEETESAQAIFIPRMDRVAGSKMKYLGLESLYSAAGICGWPMQESHSKLAKAILDFSSSPLDDVMEYFLRDLANLIFGNTDNHGRNTALLIDEGSVTISPLFDFAPMFLDPEGIMRTVRWDGERSGSIGLKELVSQATSVLEGADYPDHEQLVRDQFQNFVRSTGGVMEQIFAEAHDCRRLKERLLRTSIPYLRSLEKECSTF